MVEYHSRHSRKHDDSFRQRWNEYWHSVSVESYPDTRFLQNTQVDGGQRFPVIMRPTLDMQEEGWRCNHGDRWQQVNKER
ncbi:hypothetical protein TSUD_91200 [Trifolium subterraneum]|uniref:Uncharacterized protein n=1 Tax=Trifolium subterraneum TaxID=3900 RepID=A0A2Z6PI05_TRISU|nr:hypothetical protein TSUD_91200 [Trifolium subterraneum]